MMDEKEDRISSLPDPIIHHILSYLPSTKQAIQTGSLSKRWHKQWTHVPVLIFDFFDFPNKEAISSSDISAFIQDTLSLHECSIINNFCLQMRFFKGGYMLPEFLFNNASLLQISMIGCTFMPSGKVNWERLTTLFMNSCRIPDPAVVQHILSGSPLLKYLESRSIQFEFEKLVVSSNSLNRFVLILPNFESDSFLNDDIDIEFSCPHLEELSLECLLLNGAPVCSRLDQSIQNVLSDCLLLESLELIEHHGFDNLVIASKSLKRLVLSDVFNCLAIEICCPKLKELKLLGCLNVRTAKLKDLPYSLCATVDFSHDFVERCSYDLFGFDKNPEIQQSLIKDILQQLKHVQQLKLGRWFIKVLSDIEVGSSFSLELNIKCLILDYPVADHYYSGFASVLRNSHMLEKLVIYQPLSTQYDNSRKLNGFLEDYWSSTSFDFDGLALHLKIVTIICFLERGDKCKLVIDFVQFLLKNVIVLEKVVIVLKGCGTSSPLEVSQELLNLASEIAIVELLISK